MNPRSRWFPPRQPPPLEFEHQKVILERLEHLHNLAVQLVMYEGSLISTRLNILFGFNTIFFAAFVVLKTQISQEDLWFLIAILAIPIMGIAVGILQIFLIGSGLSAANFWRATASLIQADDDFWWPGKRNSDKDLDFFAARARMINKENTRQSTGISNFMGGISTERVPALTIMGVLIPGLFVALWFVLLAWAILTVLEVIIDYTFLNPTF